MYRAGSQSARVTLRQLCNLALPAPVLLPSLLPAIRSVVPASHAAFFYCDAVGNMVNMYAERMLPPEAMTRYYERHYRHDSHAFSRAFLRLAAATDPVSYRTISAEEKRTDYYREVLSALGVAHVMYGVVRATGNGREPIGQLSLYRGEGEPAFGAEDAEALRDVLHYLGCALAATPYAPVTAPSEQIAEEAMAVLSDDGEVIFADDGWTRLARLARGEPISPMQAKQEPKALREFLRGVVIAARAAKNALHQVDSPWGKFAFRHHALSGVTGDKATALVVSRLATESVRLAEGAAKLSLSAQQREVALLVALGQTNAEIADKLGVSVNTASYHVKQVFAKLEVHDRADVARLLRQA
jgi:DNA-binding CsgD family transcriptional regulator